MSHQHCHSRTTAGRQLASGIESEPTDPEHGRAHEHHARIVRRVGMFRESAALAENDGQHKCGHPGGRMDDDPACEILDTHFL